ncbi:M23 family metallopeptidase, partial [Ruminococcaceae bacterium OttesenSCG-928-L11]|nr:M23 family metallopeptidase [Ruminococcaceae bacterium OttesenSCG-928-L11]
IEGDSTYPGEVMVLRVNNCKEGETIRFESDIAFTPKFFDDKQGGKLALMPVSYYTGVGEHYINLYCGDRSVKWGIKVNDKKFQIQNLAVDSGTTSSTLDDQKANNEYEAAIAPLRQVADDTQHWNEFVWPISGRVTTEFGMIRYVNGRPTSSRHGAIDLAAPTGTRVNATANGRVLYAGFLQLTGNTVLIEHGFGLKSWYYHMDSLNVKTGDMVKASQKIGEVGSTGFSTGPHLHFGMSVNNVFVNPSTILESEILGFSARSIMRD